jgi:XRE family transcriptional regulator, regulator of sulfur utilization
MAHGPVTMLRGVVPAVALLLAGAADAPPQERKLLSSTFEWNDVKPESTKVGAVRHFFRIPTATVRELECHVTTLNPGETPHAPHRHVDEEVIVVREGQVESFIEGKTRRLGPGSVIVFASNELHGLRNVGSTQATYHVLRWSVGEAAKSADTARP